MRIAADALPQSCPRAKWIPALATLCRVSFLAIVTTRQGLGKGTTNTFARDAVIRYSSVIACDPYRECSVFTKKVRYLCNLFGHKVHQVTNRSSFAEYACDCGHSFLKRRTGMVMVNHPLVCLLAGHFVQFVEMRNGHAEFLCRNCGHTFCFEEKR